MNDRQKGQEKALREELSGQGLTPDEGQDKRLARYASAKGRQGLVADRILSRFDAGEKSLAKELQALRDCGSYLIFRYYFRREEYKLIGGCTCKKHLLCALCAIRRAARCIAVYSKKIDQVLSIGEYAAIFITLTVKNGDDLQERFSHLQISLKILLQRRRDFKKRGGSTMSVFAALSGAVYSSEVTFSVEKGFHPHFHMVALVRKDDLIFETIERKGKGTRVPVQFENQLVKEWREITGDSFIVDVRAIEEREGLLSALVETFKYALKMNDMEPDTQINCYQALKGRRLIGSFGELRGVKIPDENDELFEGEEEWIDVLYKYSGETFGYQEIKRGKIFDPPIKQVDAHIAGFIQRHDRHRKSFNSVFILTDIYSQKVPL